jgi:hypothetical protein
MESDEEKAANDYEFMDMTDTEVERYYSIYGKGPPMAKRFKVVADCPLIEPERVFEPTVPRYQPAWERMVRNITTVHDHKEAWQQKRGWLGKELVELREAASSAGPWLNMYLTAPPINRMVVWFEWEGSNPAGVVKRFEGTRAVTSSTGLTCEHMFTGYMDVEGELTVYTKDPAVETRLVTFHGITFDPGVELEDVTPRAYLEELGAAGFVMKPDLRTGGSNIVDIPGIVIPTPAELAAMQRPIEVIKKDHELLYSFQEFCFGCAEMEVSGEDFEDDHYPESLPVGMRFPEETIAWEERVEQAERWKLKASRRWKK